MTRSGSVGSLDIVDQRMFEAAEQYRNCCEIVDLFCLGPFLKCQTVKRLQICRKRRLARTGFLFCYDAMQELSHGLSLGHPSLIART